MFKIAFLSAFSVLTLSAAHAASTPFAGVKIFVREVANKDKTYSYHYRIVNESKEDITRLEIGKDKNEKQLLTPEMFVKFIIPTNWGDPDGDKPIEASIQTPKEFGATPYALDEGGNEPSKWFVIVGNAGGLAEGEITAGQTVRGFVLQTKKQEPVLATGGVWVSKFEKEAFILPQKEFLSEKELAARPTFSKLTVTPATLNVEQFSNQMIPFTANIEATSGDSEEPITRIHSQRCEGDGSASYFGFFGMNENAEQFQRNKKFFIKADRHLKRITKKGKAECYVYIAVSNKAGNRVFKKATFVVTSTPKK